MGESLHLIPHDLRRREMILHVADLLTSVEKSSKEIFNRIESRVDELHKEIEGIGQRADKARSQVDRLREFKNKGVRIYSSGKYPSRQEIELPDYKPIAQVSTGGQDDTEEVRKRNFAGIHIPFSEEVLMEKLQFYQYQSRTRSSSRLHEDQTPVIPWYRLKSVGSMVRFNSSQNPFMTRGKTGFIIDQKSKKKHHLDEDQVDTTQPPPSSISKDEEDEDSFFRLNSELDSAPTLIDDLPAALPELDGVASDMFMASTDLSLSNTDLFFAGPVVQTNRRPKQSDRSVVSVKEGGSVVKQIKKVSINAPVSSSSSENSFEVPQKSVDPPLVVPPLPPPPPPPMEMTSETTSPISPLPAVDGGRASLLDSIRKAAGKPKKGQVTAKELKIEKKIQKQTEKPVSGDLISDLQEKLRARRIGISGSKDQTPRTSTPIPTTSGQIEPASAMHRVASMIPPPPPTTAMIADSEDDDDWN
jgi:hypothetical protein